MGGRRDGGLFATGAARVEITIGASWARESLRYWAASPEFVNSPPYSDILCFVHILIEHYWKYNNKNNPDIKLSYKAKPIFALKLQQSKEFFFKLSLAPTELNWTLPTNSSSIPMKPNEAKFFQDILQYLYPDTEMNNDEYWIGLSHTWRLTTLDRLFLDLFGNYLNN